MTAGQPRPVPLLARLVGGRLALFLTNCLLWGAAHSLPLLTGLLMKALFDALAQGEAASTSPWTLLALVVAVDVGRLLIMAGGVYTFATFWLQIGLLMQRNLLAHLLTAPGTRRLPDSTGEAVSRFRDDVDDIAEYAESWTDFTGLAAYALMALVVMATIDPLLTAYVCLPLLVAFALTSLLRPQIRIARRAMREATGRVTDFIGEMAGGVLAIKVAGAQAGVLEHFAALNRVRRKAALRDTLITELFRSVTDNLVNIATGLILLGAAAALREGDFSVGDFALFVSYLPRLTGTMAFLGDMLVQHKRTGVAFERLERLMQDGTSEQVVTNVDLGLNARADDPFEAPRLSAPRLEQLSVRNLSYDHPSGTRALRDISFDLQPGSFTVITGPVGAGKSTLLRVLLGLLPRSGGEILWNGEPVSDPASFFVPPVSAYTPQVPRLFSDSLQENLLLGRQLGEDRVAEALEMAILAEDVARLEAGLATPVGSRGVKLSGGQVQRSAAARMFLRDAQLLVFDDLSSALDVVTEARLWEHLGRRRNVTCLVVSHRAAAFARANQVIILEGGRISASGPPELLEDELRVLAGARGETQAGVA